MGQRILGLVSAADLDLENHYLRNVEVITFYTEGYYPDVDAEEYIDLEIAQKIRIQLTGNATLHVDPEPRGPCNFIVVLLQDAVGSRTVTWPDNVKWPSGVAPTLSTAANAIDVISFYFDGTDYHGQAAFGFAVPA